MPIPPTGPTITYRAPFRTARRSRASAARPAPEPPRAAPARACRGELCRAARLLALGYAIQRALDAGEIRSYADAGRRLGMSHVRVAQVLNLTLLAPSIQEALLDGSLRVAERALRRVVAEVEWTRQKVMVGERTQAPAADR